MKTKYQPLKITKEEYEASWKPVFSAIKKNTDYFLRNGHFWWQPGMGKSL